VIYKYTLCVKNTRILGTALNVNMIESVQRRMTRMIDGCLGKEYQERLKVLNLPTLEMRAKRGDVLQVYKIMMGIDRVKKENFFGRDEGRGNFKGHSMKLLKKRVRLDIAKYSFGNRVCDQWTK